MELQQLRYVVAVAELGSFTRAAERCFVVQSALSHQIARLERDLGVRLFHRTTRRVRVTAAGEAFLPAARECLNAADRARAEVAAATGEIRGRLVVGIIPGVAAVDIPAVLRQFHAQHPHVRVGLVMGGSYNLVDRVLEGTVDVAFLGLPVDVSVEGVDSHVLARDRHVAVVAPGHRLARAKRLRLDQLVDDMFVDFPAGTRGGGRAQTDRAFDAAGLRRHVAFEVNDARLMARLIAQDLGVGLLPSAIAAQFEDIVTIPVVGAPTRVEHVVWSRLGPSPAATAFLEQVGARPPARRLAGRRATP